MIMKEMSFKRFFVAVIGLVLIFENVVFLKLTTTPYTDLVFNLGVTLLGSWLMYWAFFKNKK